MVESTKPAIEKKLDDEKSQKVEKKDDAVEQKSETTTKTGVTTIDNK